MHTIHSHIQNSNVVCQPTASLLVYQHVTLRNIVRDHDFEYNEKLTEEEKKRSDSIVHFDTPSLVLTTKADGSVFNNTKLNHEITPAALLEFVSKNRKYLKIDKEGDIVFDPKGEEKQEFEYEKTLRGLMYRFDVDIIEHDDFNSESELVYSIVVNRYVSFLHFEEHFHF